MTVLLSAAACSAPSAPEHIAEHADRSTLPTCVTIQRGTFGAVADASILSEHAATNYGATTPLTVYGGTRESLVRFDLSFLPAHATVTSASLDLKLTGTSSAVLEAHRATAAWDESTVTYASFAQAFSPSIEASAAASSTSISLDVTALASSWANGTAPNDGILLSQAAKLLTSIKSSEFTDVASRPKLSLCYVVDLCAGVTCAPLDACHRVGTCDPSTGQCDNPLALDGTACDDGNGCTNHDECHSGVCVGSDVLVAAEVSAGGNLACARTASGQAYCWGNSSDGGLGNGSVSALQTTPMAVSGSLSFTKISTGMASFGGGEHACGLVAGGAAYCWGDNTFGEIGDGTYSNRTVPTAVAGGLSFTAISAGPHHTCGVTTNGDAYCWGENTRGELGIGIFGNIQPAYATVPVPILVQGGISFADISAAGTYYAFTCGVSTSGQGYCWGNDLFHTLGNVVYDDQASPAPISSNVPLVTIQGGSYHACALSQGGDVFCWGSHNTLQLGTASPPQMGWSPFGPSVPFSDAPNLVDGGHHFDALSVGSGHTCALSSGTAYCWGQGDDGELGYGGTSNQAVPTMIPGAGFSSISAGTWLTCGILTSGKLDCWGFGGDGRLGNGTTAVRNPTPTAVIVTQDFGCSGDDCHDVGHCDPTTGACSSPVKPACQ